MARSSGVTKSSPHHAPPQGRRGHHLVAGLEEDLHQPDRRFVPDHGLAWRRLDGVTLQHAAELPKTFRTLESAASFSIVEGALQAVSRAGQERSTHGVFMVKAHDLTMSFAVKFTALGGDVIGKKQCEKLRHCIMNLDSADKLDELLALTIAR